MLLVSRNADLPNLSQSDKEDCEELSVTTDLPV
jgi:hypothetical protein